MIYLIPTPIAEDALHTLPEQVLDLVRKIDVFVVERAKTARHFVKSVGPDKPLQALTFVEPARDGSLGEAEEVLMDAVKNGRPVGVLSEAGCPGVADPGAAVVAWAHRNGVQVMPLAGPSSIVLALMASGFNGQQFAFHGYLSPKRPELAKDLRRLEQQWRVGRATQIFIETPYRSHMVLEVAVECLAADTALGMAQDLTGAGQRIRAMSIRDWKLLKEDAPVSAPAVFLLGGFVF